MYQIAILLLPIAAASGWYLAFKHYSIKPAVSSNEHAGYFKGLNYLLNEQPDKAIDVFIDLLEVDDETIDIHLALGTLFRQRGEVEKSIRIHQNLIARPQITQSTRFDVLNELGMDYMRAGLLDRAESIYLELETVDTHEITAIKQLLSIFQQEKEWLKAIEYASKLESISRVKTPLTLSHLYCEMAVSYQAKDINVAKSFIKKALKTDQKCVRANVISAEIAMNAGDYKSALKLLMSISQQDVRFTAVYLDLFIDCFDHLGRIKQKTLFLEELQAKDPSILVLRHYIEVLLAKNDGLAAARFMHEKLRQQPTSAYLKVYARLIKESVEGEELAFLREVIKQLDDASSSFQCTHCGFSSGHLSWNCPSCKQWGLAEPCLA